MALDRADGCQRTRPVRLSGDERQPRREAAGWKLRVAVSGFQLVGRITEERDEPGEALIEDFPRSLGKRRGGAALAAGLVFLSGTAPHDSATGQIKGTTIQEQTRQCLTNIAAILDEAGSSIDKIVSVTIVLADEDDFAGMNEEWLRWFPSNPPARQGAKLPAKIPGLKISIAAIAEA